MLRSDVIDIRVHLKEKLGYMVGLMHGVQTIMMSDEPYIPSVGEAMLIEIIRDIAQMEVKLERYNRYLSAGYYSVERFQHVAPFIFDCEIKEEEVPF